MKYDEKKLAEIFSGYAGRKVSVTRGRDGYDNAAWNQHNGFLDNMEMLAETHGLRMIIWGVGQTPRPILGPRQLNVFVEKDGKGGHRIANRFTLG